MSGNRADDQALFCSLRDAVATAFDRSPVRRLQESRGEAWSWSVCALPLQRGRDLLLGLNWGCDGTGHQPQEGPPENSAIEEIRKEPFGRAVHDLLARHGRDLAQMNYFNICPFRSPNISELTEDDWGLAVHRFFLPALDAIAPPRTLILGTTAVNQLNELAPRVGRSLIADLAWHAIREGGPAAGWGRGMLVGDAGRHPFIVLPHPQARLGGEVRNRIWAEAFSG